jgi:PadR family transcriptional regulator PadR
VAESDDRDLYSGLIRLHVLHHASEEPIFGLGMIEELGRPRWDILPERASVLHVGT